MGKRKHLFFYDGMESHHGAGRVMRREHNEAKEINFQKIQSIAGVFNGLGKSDGGHEHINRQRQEGHGFGIAVEQSLDENVVVEEKIKEADAAVEHPPQQVFYGRGAFRLFLIIIPDKIGHVHEKHPGQLP